MYVFVNINPREARVRKVGGSLNKYIQRVNIYIYIYIAEGSIKDIVKFNIGFF
jgi:hypothetical protein